MATYQRNASHSKTHLTKSNWDGKSLLKTVGGQSSGESRPQRAAKRTKPQYNQDLMDSEPDSETPSPKRRKTSKSAAKALPKPQYKAREVATDDEPQSSSESDLQSPANGTGAEIEKAKASSEEELPELEEAVKPADTRKQQQKTRKGRKVLQDESPKSRRSLRKTDKADEDSKPQSSFEEREDDLDYMFMSSQASRKRRPQQYRSSNIHTSSSQPTVEAKKKLPSPDLNGSGFRSMPDFEDMVPNADRALGGSKFKDPENYQPPQRTKAARSRFISPPKFLSQETPAKLNGFKDPNRFKLHSSYPGSEPAAGFRMPSMDDKLIDKSALNKAIDLVGVSSSLITEDISNLSGRTTYASNIDTVSSSSSLSSPPSSPDLEAMGKLVDLPLDDLRPSHIPDVVPCPYCKEPVERAFLEDFNGGKKLNVRKQAQFHREHKQRSAKDRWVEQGYPEIDWQALDSRIERTYPAIEDILLKKVPSYFRDELENRVKSGKERTLRQAAMGSGMAGLSPGYYGSRGQGIMYVFYKGMFN